MTGDVERAWNTPRRALILIAASQLLALTLWFSASAVGPQLEAVWGLTMGQTAGLTLAVQIGFVVGALGSAVLGLADALASRRLFVIAALIGSATNAALVVLGPGDHVIAFGLRLLTGVALAGVYPAGLKVMAGWFRKSRGMALGLLVGALTVGSAGPHLIRGFGLGWQGVVLVASALALVAALVMGIGVGDGPFEVPASRFSREMVGRVVRNRGVRLSTYGYLGHMWELYAMWTWTATFLLASSAASGSSYGSVPVITFAVIAIGGAGAWVAGIWADRHGRALVAGGSMAISGACALLTPFVFGKSVILVLPVFLVWGFSVVADSAQFSAMVTETSADEVRGTALTLQTALGFLLTLVTIRGVPWLAEIWSWQWAFPILALGPLVGVMAMVRFRRPAVDGSAQPLSAPGV
jgi:MFS family permease